MLMWYAITFLISVSIPFDFEMTIRKEKVISFQKKKKKKFETPLPEIELGAADGRCYCLTTVLSRRPGELISRNAHDTQS